MVTRRGEEEVEDVLDTLFALVRTSVIPIHACWVTREILTGEPVQLAFGPAPRPGEEAWSEEWLDDVVAPVAQSQAMSALLANGMLPDLNREETFEQFARFNPSFTPEECDQLSDFAHRHSRELLRALDRGEDRIWGSFAGAVADIGLLLTEIDEQDLSVADLMADEEPLLTVGAMLGNATLRDILIEEALRQPAPAAGLLLAAARTFDGFIRSNALALYALCALELTLSMRLCPHCPRSCSRTPGIRCPPCFSTPAGPAPSTPSWRRSARVRAWCAPHTASLTAWGWRPPESAPGGPGPVAQTAGEGPGVGDDGLQVRPGGVPAELRADLLR